MGEIQQIVIGALTGLGASTVFVLVLWVGFCVILGFAKFRQSGPRTLIVRSLDEVRGPRVSYLPPDAPRGPIDQLGGSRPPSA
ncbi:MAG: hypothetical protein HYZ58_11640 [Acidobacteria bacterium]|nr:hypothetical protein [Acidobacteriota bacterium]